MATATSTWANRLASGSFYHAVMGIVLAAAGLTLARYDVIPKIAGFIGFAGGGVVTLIALIMGLLALVLGRNGRGTRRAKAIWGVLLSLPLVAFLVSRPIAAADVPAIHDITTDLSNPPQFAVLSLRKDNMAGVESADQWRAMHQKAYGDVRPVILNRPVADVTRQAAALAKQSGWTVVHMDAEKGLVEATDAVSYIRFYDDIIIRVTPTATGGSRVDLRSVSRVGVSDMGINARRIRTFTQQLAEAKPKPDPKP